MAKIASAGEVISAEVYKRIADRHGLYPRKAAQVFGVSEDTAHNWDKGKGRIPKAVAMWLRYLEEDPDGKTKLFRLAGVDQDA